MTKGKQLQFLPNVIKGKDYTEEQAWFDMPEFAQESAGAIKRVVINFQKKEDIEAFNKATGLKVTMNTKGVFFPPIDSFQTKYIEE